MSPIQILIVTVLGGGLTFGLGYLTARFLSARGANMSDPFASEAGYRSLFEIAPVGIGVADKQGQLLAFNDAILEPGGYTRKDIARLGNSVAALYYDPADRDTVLERFARDGIVRDAEVRFKRKDGSPYAASLSLASVTIEGRDSVMAIVLDVTQRTEAETALRESETLLRLSQRAAQIGSWDWNLGTNRVHWSDQMYRLHGIDRNEFDHTPEDYLRFVHPDDRGKIEQLIADLLHGKGYPIEYRVIQADGTERVFSGSSAVVAGDDGKPVSIVGTVQDITELKRAETALRESEQRFRALAQASADGVIIHDQGVILDANHAAAKLMGLDPTDIIGLNGIGYLSRDTLKRVAGPIERGEPISGQGTMNRPDGTSFEMEFDARPVDYRGKRARVLTFRDITTRAQAERMLRGSQQRLRNFAAKLEEAREQERTAIAREIHDELGQTLTGLKMDFAWVAKHLPTGEQARSKMGSMDRLIDAMIQTVRDLAARLRPGVLDDLGLVPAIDWQVRDFAERSNIECELRLPSDLEEVDEVTATAVFRILQEALTNVARHAAATSVCVTLGVDDDRLDLTVRDDGKGIPEEVVWSPESIGLIGMRERAGGLGGRVHVERVEPSGTSVHLSLPR